MSKYLDLTGLTYFAGKVKDAINAVASTASNAMTAARNAQSTADSAANAAASAQSTADSKAGKTWTRIATDSFFDPPSTVTVTRSYVLKNENCYVVNATFYRSDGFGNETNIPLKVTYNGTMVLPCGLATQDWRVSAIGYCYVGNSKIVIGDMVGSNKYAQVHFVMPIV